MARLVVHADIGAMSAIDAACGQKPHTARAVTFRTSKSPQGWHYPTQRTWGDSNVYDPAHHANHHSVRRVCPRTTPRLERRQPRPVAARRCRCRSARVYVRGTAGLVEVRALSATRLRHNNDQSGLGPLPGARFLRVPLPGPSRAAAPPFRVMCAGRSSWCSTPA